MVFVWRFTLPNRASARHFRSMQCPRSTHRRRSAPPTDIPIAAVLALCLDTRPCRVMSRAVGGCSQTCLQPKRTVHGGRRRG